MAKSDTYWRRLMRDHLQEVEALEELYKGDHYACRDAINRAFPRTPDEQAVFDKEMAALRALSPERQRTVMRLGMYSMARAASRNKNAKGEPTMSGNRIETRLKALEKKRQQETESQQAMSDAIDDGTARRSSDADPEAWRHALKRLQDANPSDEDLQKLVASGDACDKIEQLKAAGFTHNMAIDQLSESERQSLIDSNEVIKKLGLGSK